jgi:ABC-type transporter Mla subunit MlaD
MTPDVATGMAGLHPVAQAMLAAGTLVTILIGAFQAHRAARSAASVSRRITTNAGNLGDQLTSVADSVSDLRTRVEEGHATLADVARELCSVREQLEAHLNTPHAKPRAKKATPTPPKVDLKAVSDAVNKPALKKPST